MPSDMPRNYSIGIEEEYFLVDARTKLVAPSMPEAFLNAAKETLGAQVMPEFLQSQIEVVTTPHVDMAAVAAELKHLRQTVARSRPSTASPSSPPARIRPRSGASRSRRRRSATTRSCTTCR